MAELKGLNAALRSSVPPSNIKSNAQHGRLRVLSDSFTPAVEFGAGDTVLLGAKLPKGAKIYGAELDAPILDTTSTDIDVGIAANGDQAADLDAFIDGADFVAAKLVRMSDDQGLAGHLLELDDEAQVTLTSVAATDAAIGKLIRFKLWYAVD